MCTVHTKLPSISSHVLNVGVAFRELKSSDCIASILTKKNDGQGNIGASKFFSHLILEISVSIHPLHRKFM